MERRELTIEEQKQRNPNKYGLCQNYGIGCEKPEGTPLKVEVKKEYFCCEKCANEYHLEISEGTFQPFPEFDGAISEEAIRENLSYFREM